MFLEDFQEEMLNGSLDMYIRSSAEGPGLRRKGPGDFHTQVHLGS